MTRDDVIRYFCEYALRHHKHVEFVVSQEGERFFYTNAKLGWESVDITRLSDKIMRQSAAPKGY